MDFWRVGTCRKSAQLRFTARGWITLTYWEPFVTHGLVNYSSDCFDGNLPDSLAQTLSQSVPLASVSTVHYLCCNMYYSWLKLQQHLWQQLSLWPRTNYYTFVRWFPFRWPLCKSEHDSLPISWRLPTATDSWLGRMFWHGIFFRRIWNANPCPHDRLMEC